MARTTGTRSLADLLRRGQLQHDEMLNIARRNAEPIEAVLLADGTIRLWEKTFDTPSAAAKQALGVGNVDGWIRWRVPRLGGMTLAAVRDER
jgi:hypothetical protein